MPQPTKPIIFFLLLITVSATAQIPKTISYQGLLTDVNGTAVSDGSYELTFRLYNAPDGGSPLWSENQSVDVTDGVLNAILGSTVPIDLPFDEGYYLGISVNGNDEMTPRITLTSAAYSLNALSVADNSIGSSNIRDGEVVHSVNNLTDEVIITGGDNILISQDGNSLIITSTGLGTGDITGIAAGKGLLGGGTSGDVTIDVDFAGNGASDAVARSDHDHDDLYINEGQTNAINTEMIIDEAVTESKIAGNAVTQSKIVNNAVTAEKIDPDIISTIDGVANDAGGIDFIAGSNMNIVADDANNTITFSSSGGTGGGDITAVNAGTGLTGGGTTADVTLDVDFAGSGESTTVSRSDHDHDATYVNEGQANSVTTAMILNNSVLSDDIADDAVGNSEIADQAVSSEEIQDLTILTEDLQDNSVTASKISPDIISSIDGVSNDAGDIDFIAGSDINIVADDANNTITFSSSGGTGGGDITAVNAGTGLTGGGTTADVTLDVDFAGSGESTTVSRSDHDHDATYVNEGQANSITTAMILNNSVLSDDIADDAVGNSEIADQAVSSEKIQDGQVVKSLNQLKDNVRIVEGDNISVTTESDSITISVTELPEANSLDQAYNQGGSGLGRTITADAGAVNIAGDDGLTVNGNIGIGTTSASYPLSIFPGNSSRGVFVLHNQTGSESTSGIYLDVNRTGTGNADAYGVYSVVTNDDGVYSTQGLFGNANGSSTGPKYGIYGNANGEGTLYGVRGWTNPTEGTQYGVQGVANGSGTASQYGVFGSAQGTGTGAHYGVYGITSGGGTNQWAGYFMGRVYADGNIGIGTQAPACPLDVTMSGPGEWQQGIRLLNPALESGNHLMLTIGRSDDVNNAGNLYFTYDDDASESNRLSLGLHTVNDVLNILANGNVGIGTVSPSAKFTLSGSSGSLLHGESAVYIQNSNRYFDFNGGMIFRGSGTNWNSRFTATSNIASDGEVVGIYKHEAEAGDAMNDVSEPIAVFRNNGNVGIGLSDPDHKLVVADTIRSSLGGFQFPDGTVQTTAATGGSVGGNTLDDAYDQGGAGAGRTITADAGAVNIAGSDGLTVNGRIGIGTSTPEAGIHLYGSGYPKSFMFLQSQESSDAGLRFYEGSAAKWHIFNNAASNGLQIYNTGGAHTVFFADQATGNVGIGLTNPDQGLVVADTIRSSVGGFQFPDGTVQTTAATGGAINNTLDQAYDQGGPGVGRTITADNGAVHIDGDDGFTVTGNVGIGTTTPSDPLTIVPGSNGTGLFIDHDQTTDVTPTRSIYVDLDVETDGNPEVFGAQISTTNNSTSGTTIGVQTNVRGTAGGSKYGVYSDVYGDPGATGDLIGVYAHAGGTGGNAYGIFAQGGTWAGYFSDGNVHVENKLGIGTLSPTADLHVEGSNGFVVTSDMAGTIPVNGPGTRLMWYPGMHAFRAGTVGDEWDEYNIGDYTFATGLNTKASGTLSMAMGYYAYAEGDYSTALGDHLIVEGDHSFGIALGSVSNNIISQDYTMAILGGKVGINESAPTADLHVNGKNGFVFTGETHSGTIPIEGGGARMMWYQDQAVFRCGIVTDAFWDADSIGEASFAAGANTVASEAVSTAFGENTRASGIVSTAMGRNTAAGGRYSTAMGSYISTTGEGSFAIGDYSTTTTPTFNTTNQFNARYANGYNLYTSSDLSSGAQLLAGANSWSSISDSTKKENLKPVNGEEFLNKISSFKLSSWNYKGQDPAQFRHYGPMAQDFYAAFGYDGVGTIGNDTTLASADFDGVNFIAIQALEKRTTDLKKDASNLEKEVVQLREENDLLKKELALLKSRFETIEAILEKKGEVSLK